MRETTAYRFEALDGFRGVAAFFVLLHHLEITAAPSSRYFSLGYLSVDLFFILSGFVIAFAYDKRLSDGLSLSDFAVSRIIRLYPLVFVGAVVGGLQALAAAPAMGLWPVSLAAQLTFIPAIWGTGNIYPFNAIQWSLLFELLVNFAYAAAFRHLSLKTLMLIVGATAILLAATTLHYRTVGVGWGSANIWGGMARAAFGFSAGALLFRCWDRDLLPKVKASPWMAFAAFAVLLVVPARLGHDHWVVALPIVLIALPALVWTVACSSYSAASGWWMTFIGGLSFPMYALQGPIRTAMTFAMGAQVRTLPGSLIVVAAVVVVSWAAWKLYDEPIRARLTSFLRVRRMAATPQTVP